MSLSYDICFVFLSRKLCYTIFNINDFFLNLPGKEDVSLCEQAVMAVETCTVVCCVNEQVQPLKVRKRQGCSVLFQKYLASNCF